MEELVEVGSITLFVNESPIARGELTNQDASILAKKLEYTFRERFQDSTWSEHVKITNVTWQRGCVIETITFGVAAAFVYKFIKDYPDFREGLIAIAKDIKTITEKINGKKSSTHSTTIYKSSFKKISEIKKKEKK